MIGSIQALIILSNINHLLAHTLNVLKHYNLCAIDTQNPLLAF